MKISIVIPSFSGGGAEKIGVNMANYYSSSGHDVHVVCLSIKGPLFQQLLPTVDIICFHCRARCSIFKLVKYFICNTPDIIISVLSTTNFLVALAAPFVSSTIIFHEANTLDAILKLPYLNKFLLLSLRKVLYPFADYVVANSANTRDDLVKYTSLPQESIACISNPVLPEELDYLKSLPPSDLTEVFTSENKVILNVGRLHAQKNQIHLVQACHRLLPSFANLKLVIIGEGELYDQLTHYIDIHNLSNSIYIIPFQQNPFAYYARCDLFVLSSLWEGFGNVVVEALACGTPVIATKCNGGPKDILKDGRLGTLVDPNNLEALTLSISNFLDGKISNPSVKLLRRYTALYSVRSISQQYLKLALFKCMK
jgi:glycosyltransferase involved in cell wall biosynthesis